MTLRNCGILCVLLAVGTAQFVLASGKMQSTAILIPRFPVANSGLEISRMTHAGTFFDVVGRRSAVFGYENRGFEAWAYPMKLIEDFRLSFHLEGYPIDLEGTDLLTRVEIRPEATIFTYAHAAFTVREIVFAPIDQPGVIILLSVDSTLPISVRCSFRPKLSLAWPAGLMTGGLDWEDKEHRYYLTEESNRFVGIVGSPAAKDVSDQPFQEEPRGLPAAFVVEGTPEQFRSSFIPIVIAGAATQTSPPPPDIVRPRNAPKATNERTSLVSARDNAKATYDLLLRSAKDLYGQNVQHYRTLLENTTRISTPDASLNDAFLWAKVGVDKGIATNPFLGTGLLAGFRTSGESERPGFAWFFGRDAMWTTLAINSYGDFASTRAALKFLKQFQRSDGKVPHEISQSASLIPWFTDYVYPWASADATPLYVIASVDYWRTTGDETFTKENWQSIKNAWQFTASTDTDGNGLIENTEFGHGWVEGGSLYPPHEELYMQGLFVEASLGVAELARQMNDEKLANAAARAADRTRKAIESTYWLSDKGFYAFATKRTSAQPEEADPGPNRERRQARLNELASKNIFDEDTVLPAVPMWWRQLQDDRAQTQIDRLADASIATDWGARIISNESRLYDPLSYHTGSVWPLFTGWVSMAAYSYGRPHAGYQAIKANANLAFSGGSGWVTELLSGDFNTAFGRSSHHQIWSEAMVITPIVRGLFGLEVTDQARNLRFAPRLPADWNKVEVDRFAAGSGDFDISLEREASRMSVDILERTNTSRSTLPGLRTISIAPAFPLDARVKNVSVEGKSTKFSVTNSGDVQIADVAFDFENLSRKSIDTATRIVHVVFEFDEGTDVFVDHPVIEHGASNSGLRIIRSTASEKTLRLVLEGLAGRAYSLGLRSSANPSEIPDIKVKKSDGGNSELQVTFHGDDGKYVRQEFVLPLERGTRTN